MIKITLKENLIKEALSSIVFHYRNLNETVNILQNDEFICGMLSQDMGGSSDHLEKQFIKSKFYYLSTARSPLNTYIRKGSQSTDPGKDKYISLECAFELDGNKLKNKYKSVTIDYFNYFASKHTKTTYPGDEMEDRVLTNEPTIKNAHKYIKRLHIKVISVNNQLQTIEAVCKSKGIPVCYYYVPRSYEVSPKKQAYGSLAGRYFKEGDSPEKKALRLNKGIYFSIEEMQSTNPNDFNLKSMTSSSPTDSTYGDPTKMQNYDRSIGYIALISNVYDGTPIPSAAVEGAKKAKEYLNSIKTDKYKLNSEITGMISAITSGSALRGFKEIRSVIENLVNQAKEFYNTKSVTVEQYTEFIKKMAKRVLETDFDFEEKSEEEPKSELKENKIRIKIGNYK